MTTTMALVVGLVIGVVGVLPVIAWIQQWGRGREVPMPRDLSSSLLLVHRKEYEQLSMLVGHVREHEERAGAGALGARLDALLRLYLDRALELRSVSAASLRTRFNEPSTSIVPLGTDDWPHAELAYLRARAREQCHHRVQRLESELASIGQIVRLAHEQAFASEWRPGETEMLADVFKKAEGVLAGQA